MSQNSAISIDDFLGPTEGRFFGSGFKRVSYDWRDELLDETRACSVVGLGYPADWSRKLARRALKPHLSTIDAIVIAAALCERILASRGLNLSQLWFRQLAIKAGSQPAEDLGAVRAELRATNSSERDTLRFNGEIGPMSVRLALNGHDLTSSGCNDKAYDPHASHYGVAFKNRSQHIQALCLEGVDRASAQLNVREAQLNRPNGIESGRDSPSLIDLFVTHLQIAQVLLYRLDRIQRSESSTLWMRNTSFDAVSPAERVSESSPIHTMLSDLQLLPSDDGSWRTTTIVGTSPGVTLRCAVAHLLPVKGKQR